ncbi:hypothetical protein [Natribacillus halophilus]|uniref:Uncharacterized protein n=1 Tax=Natribacillus halophilus TaxID=549003 RepID=A0A1G8J7B7_9BACI|nr:hypothetical protein [Natribacillus halophilus]SDI26887.1 hypothetical protein SAMN04488123_10160 [Natribacillus halophilus]
MTRTIGNIGILNMLHTKEENLENIERIGNVGIAIIRKGNGHLLQKLNVGNIGVVKEVEENYKVIQGGLTINESYLEQLVEPLRAFVQGALIVEKDVKAETFRERVDDIQLQGGAIVPNEIRGAIESKLGDIKGSVIGYEQMPEMFIGEHTVTKQMLMHYDQPITLISTGMLTFADDVDPKDIDDHIETLYITGVVELRERLEPVVRAKMATGGAAGDFEVIPDGYYHVREKWKLNQKTLKRLPHNKLFSHDPIIFSADISREQLAEKISNIHSHSYIIVPEHLEDLLIERCDRLETDIISYEKEYLHVEEVETWNNEALLNLDETVSMIVDGTLTFAADVTKEALQNVVSSIGNFGKIIVTDQQLLHVKRLVEDGDGKVTTESSEEEGMGNIGTLTL